MGGIYFIFKALGSGSRANASTVASKSSRPFLLLAVVPITGTPSSFESLSKSTQICFFFASSNRFTQTTTRFVNSIVCNTRFKLRSKHVASHTTMVASGCLKQIKFLATSSSAE